MTKLEALAKDCIENHTHRLVNRPTKQDIYLREESIFIQGYRLSEKQIQIDAEHIRALQEQNGELTDKVRELEAQIERMKCCGNCAKKGHICVAEEMQGKLCGKNKDKWELRR